MLNKIWIFLVVGGILFGVLNGLKQVQTGEVIKKQVDGKTVVEIKPYESFQEKAKAYAELGDRLTNAAINSATYQYEDPDTKKTRSGALGIVVGFTGMMMVWLGFMKIAEKSGLISLLALAIAPIFRWLFPKVPVDHPAAGAVMMNVAANMLGLDNAATPLGIKAMQELQTLNGKKDTASNAMCMFLALNTSSLTLLPAGVIAYRLSEKSLEPTGIIVPILIATGCGKLAAIISCKVLEKLSPDTPSLLHGETAPQEAN